jgi:bifunctional non-homologous end joining protein LigD
MKQAKDKKEKKLSRFISPMLAQLFDGGPFDDKDWVFELKWDGYRAVAEVTRTHVKLYSRNGLSFADRYGKVADALKKIKSDVVVDGEIVVFDKRGKPNFQQLQNYADTSGLPIQYMIFDCLSIDGKDITQLPLVERKLLLQKLLPKKSDILVFCDHVDESGIDFFREVQGQDFEGMIAKRRNSRYYLGKRTTDWLKIKNVRSEEAIIVGYTAPKGSRAGFGSLLLGQFVDGKLIYVGNVGTGFSDDLLRSMHARLKSLATAKNPLDLPIKPPAHTTWVAPELVCNVKYTERTTDGMMRHPVFLGLRIDKEATSVVPEKSLPTLKDKNARKGKTRKLKPKSGKEGK